jgi:alkaline phosphatase
MIPDGTSIGVVSAARWYNGYMQQGRRLNLDPLMCGTGITFCSDDPIADSGCSTSCYMTGVVNKESWISTYPRPSDDDCVPVDATRAYQPAATVLEAAKTLQNKATGLVVTCYFPHATPADCAAHYRDRDNYKLISSQMVYNNLDVVFGGGTNFISDDSREHFKANGTTFIENDVQKFREYDSPGAVWALFAKKELPYDLDTDHSKIPSLEEMTSKAIKQLSKNPNGFFLMVEGSRVDHAAHANDPIGCITEMLAFDRAVGAALDFARKDGNTAIVILPDHGNSGFTIGRRGCPSHTLDGLFQTMSQFKKTAGTIADILKTTPPDQIDAVFKQYTGLDLTDDERKTLLTAKDYKGGSSDYTQASDTPGMGHAVSEILNNRTCFGFTTGSHTGEEVFLAAYHPKGEQPTGVNTNVALNHYLCQVLGFNEQTLPTLSDRLYAKHTDVLNGLSYSLDKDADFPVLTVKKKRNTLVLRSCSSVAYLNNQPIDLGSVMVYMDRNDTFYLPADLLQKVKW